MPSHMKITKQLRTPNSKKSFSLFSFLRYIHSARFNQLVPDYNNSKTDLTIGAFSIGQLSLVSPSKPFNSALARFRAFGDEADRVMAFGREGRGRCV